MEGVCSLQAAADTCYKSGIFPSLFTRTEGWVFFISFSIQVIQLPACIIKIMCFMFHFCKVLPDMVGKYFKGAKHNLLEGWVEGTWHREAE